MRNKKEKIIAVLISVLLHALLLIVCLSYRLPGVTVPARRKIQLFGVKIVKDERMKPVIKRKQYIPERKLELKEPVESESIKQFIGAEESDRGKYLGLPKEQIKALEGKAVLEDAPVSQERFEAHEVLKEKETRITRSSLWEPIKLVGEDLVDPSEELLVDGGFLEAFVEKMPGFTPALTSSKFGITEPDKGKKKFARPKAIPVITRIQEMDELKSDLEWTLETYQDPKDQQKYFRIVIRALETSENLPTMPKEIVFLIDCSISIEQKRLMEFKDGIEYSLKHLNEGDLFNVIAFKKRIIFFKPRSVEATEENKSEAFSFITELRAGQRTDVYAALLESVKRETLKEPSYIILLSDGFPTYGVTNPLELITKISEVNDGRVPIFAFSGGIAVNRYLLDFISYTNRGWTEYSRRKSRIGEKLSRMYDKIDDPIILDLRYFVNGAEENETFPKRLPDFFRGAEFTLHGKYADRDKFIVQLLGDVQDKTSEFLMEGTFSSGTPGGKKIARDWAFNKIFHLISQLQYDKDNQAIIDEIKGISGKFNIRTPYLRHILK